MPDFSKLLKRPAGEAKEPKALPPGDYTGIIKNWEMKEAPQGKDYESLVRFSIGLVAWPDSMDESDKLDESGEAAMDLGKRQLRRDFYDNALYRLDELIRSCGVDPAGQTYEETLPQLIGRTVLVEVQQYMNQQTNKIGNQVGKLVGLDG